MEVALLIDDLSLYKGNKIDIYSWQWGNVQNGIYNAIERFNNSNSQKFFTHLYFGNEFCEYRMPSISEIERCIMIAEKDSMRFVLVTPPVTDYGIQRLSYILDYFSEKDITLEIVVNDFGVLELIAEKKSTYKMILGRVMDKISHDSRASSEKMKKYYGIAGLEFARTPGVISAYANKILGSYNIQRYEFDMPEVGLNLEGCKRKSLYWPYSYLTTGRVCYTRSLSIEGKDKFLVGAKECSQQCRKVQIEKRKPLNGFGDNKSDLYLFERGNALFYISESNFDFNEFDRIVLQL